MPIATRRKSRAVPKLARPAEGAWLNSTQILRDHEGYLIRELQHRLHLKLEAELRKRSIFLSFPLAHVLYLVSTEPGISGAQLARRCSVTAQTMNGLLIPLDKDGLIERKADPENARVLKCYALPAGVAVMQKAIGTSFEIFDAMLKVLSPRERTDLRRMLKQCIDALKVDDEQGAQETAPAVPANTSRPRAKTKAKRKNGR